MRCQQRVQHQEQDVVIHHVRDRVVADAIHGAVRRQPERDHDKWYNRPADEPNKTFGAICQSLLPESEENRAYFWIQFLHSKFA